MDKFKVVVEEYFGVKWDAITDKGKEKKVCYSRNFVYYILHCKYNLSIGKIAKMFNRCDREIKYRIAIVRAAINYQKKYIEAYKAISAKLPNSLELSACR